MVDSIVPHTLDDYFQSTPIGSLNRAIGNNLFGFNHRNVPGLVPMNRDSYGLAFFVKPQLNFQADNIRNHRLFYPLLSKDSRSIQRFTRCTLDPRLMYGYGMGSRLVPPIDCPVMDNLNAFIPILNNNLGSMSGWPDMTAPTFSSKPGLYGEVYSQVDGITRFYGEFDMEATFTNTRGDPIIFMFYIWLTYMAMVNEGILVPYPDFIVENEIDYNTRIYRLVLDKEKHIVTKIAATGVAFPISDPMGQFFDFNVDQPYNDQAKDITIRFRCLGAQYMDPILIDEFNATVKIFHPGMRDNVRPKTMRKLKRAELNINNNRGYPRINPDNYELEWWV